jgi:hypothetical protein
MEEASDAIVPCSAALWIESSQNSTPQRPYNKIQTDSFQLSFSIVEQTSRAFENAFAKPVLRRLKGSLSGGGGLGMACVSLAPHQI